MLYRLSYWAPLGSWGGTLRSNHAEFTCEFLGNQMSRCVLMNSWMSFWSRLESCLEPLYLYLQLVATIVIESKRDGWAGVYNVAD